MLFVYLSGRFGLNDIQIFGQMHIESVEVVIGSDFVEFLRQ